jgi:hypothetical protein
MFRHLKADLRQIEDLMLDHFDASLVSQVSAAVARCDGVINGVVWFSNRLQTMTGMPTLTATFLA